MILKFKDLNGNWNFREGEISYRFCSIANVLTEFVDKNSNESKDWKKYSINDVFSIFEEILIESKENDVDLSTYPTTYNLIVDYIVNHFDRAGDSGMFVDITNLPSQNHRDIRGMYIVEIYRPEKLENEYVILNSGEAYLLSDTGKTIEKLM